MPTTYHKPIKDNKSGKWYVLEDRSDEGKSCRMIEFPGEQSASEYYRKKNNLCYNCLHESI